MIPNNLPNSVVIEPVRDILEGKGEGGDKTVHEKGQRGVGMGKKTEYLHPWH